MQNEHLRGSPEADSTEFIPSLSQEYANVAGRKFGVVKVPGTSFVRITATGKGDLPDRLKGNWTSTMLAEKEVKNYLKVEKMELARKNKDLFPSDERKDTPDAEGNRVQVEDGKGNEEKDPVEKEVKEVVTAENSSQVVKSDGEKVVPVNNDNRAGIATKGSRRVAGTETVATKTK